MMAWIGGRIWLAVRLVIRVVRMANDGQVHVWECVLLTSRTVPVMAIGPLRWVSSRDGNRLIGSYLPSWD
jgi:hypothetical protein